MITNETEFQTLMQEVDAEMIAEGIPIVGRQIAAGCKVADKLGIAFKMGGEGLDHIQLSKGVYSGDNLSLRIIMWFSDLYGEKQKVDFDIGVVAIEIFGDVFKMRLPFVYGNGGFFIDPAKIGHKENSGNRNILNYVVDLEPALASRLSTKDCDNISTLFMLGMDVFGNIASDSSDELISKAHADLKTSAFHLFNRPPDPELSKWASLQAVEKTLKSFIARRGGKYPFGRDGHNLGLLAEISEKNGLPPVDRILIGKLQCQAGVRYKDEGLTIKDAVDAQHTGLQICCHTFKHFRD